MGTIANLITYVGASTGEFHRGMSAVIETGGKVASAFVTVGAVAGTALAGIATASAKMAIDFQDQMGDVATLIEGDATAAMEKYGDQVKRISKLTGKGLSNISEGLYETISAWGESADSAKQLEIAAKSAVGGKAETLDAVKMLSVVTKGYGDTSAAAVQKVADLAFQTANLGQTTFPELAANMGETVPMANALGVQVEALFGTFATLTGVTGNTSEVATQLKATFSALLNPTTEMAAKLTKLGFANGKAAIESMGLQGVLDLLAQATGGNTAQLAKMFGSTEALNAILALTGAQSADFTAKTQAMAEAAGAADTAFEKKKGTVAGLWAQLKATAEVVAVDIGAMALPALQSFLNWVNDNMPTIQAGIETALSAVGTAFRSVKPAWDEFKANVWDPFVAGATTGTTSANTDITGWAQNVGVQFGLAADYISNWRTTIWEPFVEGFKTGNTDMETKSDTTWATIGNIIRSVSEIIASITTILVAAWSAVGDEVMMILTGMSSGMLSIFDGALQIIRGTLSFFIHLFTGDWSKLWDDVKMIFEGFWKIITGIFRTAWSAFDGLMTALLGDTWTNFKQWAADMATSAWNWGSAVLSGFWEGAKSWFGKIWDGLKEFGKGVADTVKGVLGIHSPSRVFMGIGENIGAGLAMGISSSESMVNRSLADLAGGQVDVAMRSLGSAASGGYAGPREIRVPVSIGDQDFGEYVIDLVTGTVRQPKRAMGHA